MPTSTLVITNNVAKTPRQMALAIREWEEYVSTPLVNPSQLIVNGVAIYPATFLPTEEQLAEKAKKMGLIDGLPFTHYYYQNGLLVEIDLESVEQQFETIQRYCEELAPYHPLFDSQKIKQIKVGMTSRYGFVRITTTLRKKMQLIYDFIKTLQDRLTGNSDEIFAQILLSKTGKEKAYLVNTISNLTWIFRRDFFSDIPVLLKAIDISPVNSLYLFDYEQAIIEPHILDQIKELVEDRSYIRSDGDEVEEIEDLLAHIKEEALFSEDEDLHQTAARLEAEIAHIDTSVSILISETEVSSEEFLSQIKQLETQEAALNVKVDKFITLTVK